jgi:subfamily B ATP-binding cassette protein HlyB/CyaB
VAIARSLIKVPKVIILDEPTSALDGEAQRRMALEMQKLKHEVTLIIITHNPDIFENPDQVVDFEAMR